VGSVRGRRPSPALIVAFLALVVALGGTALAATGQLVNIVDPGSPSQKARVDSSGALRVGQASPATAFFGFTQPGSGQTLVGPTKATLAFSRLEVSNPADNPTMRISIAQVPGNSTTCVGEQRTVALYAVPAGTTVSDPFPTPAVLKPAASGQVWCLKANFEFQGNPSSFTLPAVSWSGYAMAGNPPANAAASAATGARRAHRGG
jgi:hypothetical protein